jgi:hypothetical protein
MKRPKRNYEYEIFLITVIILLFPTSLLWFYSVIQSVIEDIDLIYSFSKWIQFIVSGFLFAYCIDIIYRVITNKKI